ncbi:MAG: hypothetical protein HQM04_18205 [Magnetococcales bacterium]|nr:hypothetical protein [Magnetococcales bacterium]MBF0116961.1 hypothetical protein [Magnetococcales bacterium]
MSKIRVLPRIVLFIGLSMSIAACASMHVTHSTNDLVESGAFKVEATETDTFQVDGVRVFKDTDGLHVHGFVKRAAFKSSHLEISLLDRAGVVLYERVLQPNELHQLHDGHKSPTGTLKNEKFNIALGNVSAEQGTVRVVLHPGAEHDVKKP